MFVFVEIYLVSNKYQLFKPYNASIGDKCAFPSNCLYKVPQQRIHASFLKLWIIMHQVLKIYSHQ